MRQQLRQQLTVGGDCSLVEAFGSASQKKKAAVPFSGAEVLPRPERVETPIGQ